MTTEAGRAKAIHTSVCYPGSMTWYAIRLLPLLLALTVGPAAAAGPSSEPALLPAVLDGDTLRIAGVSYRLHGIDAPEKSQICQRDGHDWLCGQEAAAFLRRLIRGRAVTCQEKDRDRYGRVVAVCFAGGRDLNRAMVRAGLAWAYTAYSRDYADAELEAQILRSGIWAPDVAAQPAWDWRRERRAKPARIRG
jgi:endonuclease YncB( thermonuclease family)